MHACFTAVNKWQELAKETVSMLAYGNFTAWNFLYSTAKTRVHSNRSRQEASPAFTNTHNCLTIAPFPLEVHMAPLAIIKPLVTGFNLDAA